MVIVGAFENIDMERYTSSGSKRQEDVRNHLAREVTDLLSLQAKVDGSEWATGDIDHCTGKGLVKWAVCVAKTLDTLWSTESLLEGHTKGNSGVFGSVVVIDVQVAGALEC